MVYQLQKRIIKSTYFGSTKYETQARHANMKYIQYGPYCITEVESLM